jgi:SAM-dependent methyltransferase
MAGPDWEERIVRDTHPAVRVEHEVRYRVAAALIGESPMWADLGCGNGIAAREALGERLPERVLLVDNSEDALAQAPRELNASGISTLQADLTSPDDLDRIRQELTADDASGGCVTAFEVIEHLTDFAPIIELLVELAERNGFTSVLSVPNDAFWSIDNPFHVTKWGAGAFEELRRLLPPEHVVAHQQALHGSIAVFGDDVDPPAVRVEPTPIPVATHFLTAFGPAAGHLRPAAGVAGADLLEQRRWERQRESDCAHLQATEQRLRSELEFWETEIEDWRKYIRELEERLGLPNSETDARVE